MRLIACQECKRQWDVSPYGIGQHLRCVCGHLMTVRAAPSFAPQVLHCEACGAARSSPTGPCEYCEAVPTEDEAKLSLVCPFCFHRTADRSRFCSSCGRPIQPSPLDARTGKLACPRCQTARLVNRMIGDFAVDECPRCSGLWVGAGTFDRIVAEQVRRYREETIREPGRHERYRVESGPVRYLRCPRCDRFMNRRNFGRASGVIVDECRDDGVWLDADELGKIAAFLASGGLEYSRRLEREEEAYRQRLASVPRIPVASAPGGDPSMGPAEKYPIGSILEFLWNSLS